MKRNITRACGILAVLAAAALLWQFGVKPRLFLFQSWTGTIKEPYRVRDMKNPFKTTHQEESVLYDYYWRVEFDQGETIDIEMARDLWIRGYPGARVVKESGTRYPTVVGEAPRKAPPEPEAAGETSALPEEELFPPLPAPSSST